LAATVLGSSIAFINASVVNVALPAIRSDLNASVVAIQWVVNAYTLCLAALILIGGAAGDHFGRRRLFAAGIAVFAAASVWCGLAPDIAQLIVARAAQGIGAAMLIPNSLAIIGATFDDSGRGRAIGTWAGFAALAAAAGPLIGGWLVDHTSWRIIFFVGPLIAAPTLWIALRHVPESRDPGSAAELDWVGALLIFLGLAGVVAALIAAPALGWGNAVVLGLFGGGALMLVGFFWQEHASVSPMMPLSLFRSRVFSGINALTFLLYAALGGALFMLPFDLIYGHGYSATQAGGAFLPFALTVGILSRLFGAMQDKVGARLPLVAGPAIAGFGYVLLAMQPFGDGFWAGFIGPLMVVGFGMAVSVAPLTTVVLTSVPKERAGVASGVNNAVAQTANLVAVAIFGAIALGGFRQTTGQAGGAAVRQALASGSGTALLLAAALAFAGSLVSLFALRLAERTAEKH
jgi:EmrB/QacA subfamily drug resistance transporter